MPRVWPAFTSTLRSSTALTTPMSVWIRPQVLELEDGLTHALGLGIEARGALVDEVEQEMVMKIAKPGPGSGATPEE